MPLLGFEVMPWAVSGERMLRGPHKGRAFKVDKSQSSAASSSKQKKAQLCSGGKCPLARLGLEGDSEEHVAELPCCCLLIDPRRLSAVKLQAFCPTPLPTFLNYKAIHLPQAQGIGKVVVDLRRNPGMMEAQCYKTERHYLTMCHKWGRHQDRRTKKQEKDLQDSQQPWRRFSQQSFVNT